MGKGLDIMNGVAKEVVKRDKERKGPKQKPIKEELSAHAKFAKAEQKEGEKDPSKYDQVKSSDHKNLRSSFKSRK